MSLIIWLFQVQWNHAVEDLTYNKLWSVERLTKLCLGCMNLVLLGVVLFHSAYWLIPLGIVNLAEMVAAIRGKIVLGHVFLKMGFKEQRDISMLDLCTHAKPIVYADLPLTGSSAFVYVFDAVDSQTANTISSDDEFIQSQQLQLSSY